MRALLTDEDFHGVIVRGLLRRRPELDIVRAQDVGLSGADDPTILEVAAQSGRIVLTHDVTTMTRYAYERIESGLPMPGIVVVDRSMPFGQAIEELLIFAECSREDEWEDRVCYLPL